MAWTAVPTFASGQILTAAQMNGLGSDLTALRGDFAISRYTTGNITANGTNWTNLGGPADITFAASTDDVVQVAVSLLVGGEAVDIYFDVQTIVSSSAVNSVGTGTTVSNTSRGVVGWQCFSTVFGTACGSFFYKLVSGDISGGNVTLRLRYRTASATNKVIYGATDYPMTFMARNHGPVDS